MMKDSPRLRKSRNSAGKMFWDVDGGGALIFPGAQGLAFVARRSTALRSLKPNPRLRAEVAVERG